MGGGKETPRQKMIGMMYLVLTALLAMNVSKQILHGYVAVNESIEKAKENMHENNERLFKAFEDMAGNTAAAKPYLEKAILAQKEIMEVYKYIGVVKTKVIAFTEKKDEKTADTMRLEMMEKTGQIDNYDAPSGFLIGSEAASPKTGEFTASELKGKLKGLYDHLIGIVDGMQKDPKIKLPQDDYDALKKKLKSIEPDETPFMEGNVKFGWEAKNFYHLPEAAVVTTLNKMQADLKNVEADILQVFSGASGKLAIKFDAIKARVVAPSSYIQAGQPYMADIFLAASSSKLAAGDMEIIIGVDSAAAANGAKGTLVPIVSGEGKYEVGTGGEGDQEYKGVIKYKNPDGTFKYYPFQQSYKVAKSAATVSADQMNVFYAGVPNPVTAAAAGISPADISVSATGAGVKVAGKGNGKYEFTFTGTGECMVSVSAKTKDGVKSQGPPIKFRVKPLPKPELKLGGKFAPQELKKGELSLVSGLGAGANGFDFQANYVVQSWEVVGKANGKLQSSQGNGNNLDAMGKQVLAKADVGSKVYIDAKIKGPDGKITSVTCAIKVAR
ncbi:MAG: gliding motility-associated protein GldM, partial [Bacteroidetes bacterium]|jgi:gliding motility-associated protein GldM|nr:gliding motility-associated protein GldM [Bacteroidota bacterium]